MSVQKLDDRTFLVDETVVVCRCGRCNEPVVLEKFDMVHNANFPKSDYDPLIVTWEHRCSACGNHIMCCLRFDEGFRWTV